MQQPDHESQRPAQSADHEGLSEQLEHEATQLQEQSEKLHGDVADARDDWERKRRDPNVPGALEPADPESDKDTTAESSPAPQAPPEDEGPSQAETAPEGAVGPPKDQIEDRDDAADRDDAEDRKDSADRDEAADSESS